MESHGFEPATSGFSVQRAYHLHQNSVYLFCSGRWIRTTDHKGYEPCKLPLLHPAIYTLNNQGKSKNKNLIFLNKSPYTNTFLWFLFLLCGAIEIRTRDVCVQSRSVANYTIAPYVNSFQILGDEVTIWTYSLYKSRVGNEIQTHVPGVEVQCTNPCAIPTF